MDEYTSSTMYNTMDQSDPVMTFQSFIDDDENIVDEVISKYKMYSIIVLLPLQCVQFASL